MSAKRLASALPLLALLAHGPLGRARAQVVELVWRAPAACPASERVEQAVARALSARPRNQQPFVANAQIDRLPAGKFRLRLALVGGAYKAQRSLESASCEELAVAASWLIAVAIDPEARRLEGLDASDGGEGSPPATAASAATAGAATSTPPPEAVAASAPPLEAAAASARPPGAAAAPRPAQRQARPRPTSLAASSVPTELRSRPRGRAARWSTPRVSAGPVLGVGNVGLPATQLLVGGVAALDVGPLRVDLGLAGFLPRERIVARPIEVRVWSLEVGLAACRMWGNALRFGPCLGIAGIRSVGHAENLAIRQDRTVYWAVARAELRLTFQLTKWLELASAAGLGTPISPRPGFDVAGIGRVSEASRWNGFGRIGFAFGNR